MIDRSVHRDNILLASSHPLEGLYVEKGQLKVGTSHKGKSASIIDVITTLATDLVAVKGAIDAPLPDRLKKLEEKIDNQLVHLEKLEQSKSVELLKAVFHVKEGPKSGLKEAITKFKESRTNYQG